VTADFTRVGENSVRHAKNIGGGTSQISIGVRNLQEFRSSRLLWQGGEFFAALREANGRLCSEQASQGENQQHPCLAESLTIIAVWQQSEKARFRNFP
jgi:hypothetical protein